jgi:hypothetical protein
MCDEYTKTLSLKRIDYVHGADNITVVREFGYPDKFGYNILEDTTIWADPSYKPPEPQEWRIMGDELRMMMRQRAGAYVWGKED